MNELTKKILIHSSKYPDANWDTDSEWFKEWKHNYNQGYYQDNKFRWGIEDSSEELHKQEDEIQKKIDEYMQSETQRAIELTGDSMTRALHNVGPMASAYMEEHKQEIASAAVDSLEQSAGSAMSIGKAFMNELFTRGKNKLQKKVSDIGTSIKNTVTRIGDGLGNLINKFKSLF